MWEGCKQSEEEEEKKEALLLVLFPTKLSFFISYSQHMTNTETNVLVLCKFLSQEYLG